MAFTVYDASVPPLIRLLQNLSRIMDKAVAQAKQKDMPLSNLLDARLAADMHPFSRQIQLASDAAKSCAARLAGIDPPSMPDTETTFPELHARIAKTITFLEKHQAGATRRRGRPQDRAQIPQRRDELHGPRFPHRLCDAQFRFPCDDGI